jgi:hypothetical protein
MFWDMIVTVWSLVDGTYGAAWASLVIHPELRMAIASAIPMQSVNRCFMVSPYMLIFFRRVEEVDPLAFGLPVGVALSFIRQQGLHNQAGQ